MRKSAFSSYLFYCNSSNNSLSNVYVSILSGVDERFTYEMFRKIDAATTKTRQFYSNTYYIFSLKRNNPMLEQMLDYDTVILVVAETFFTRDYIQFFDKMQIQ